jgi:hypothetical protein
MSSTTSSAPNRHAFALTTYASVKLETEMSHEFHDLFRPGLWKALVIGALIKA